MREIKLHGDFILTSDLVVRLNDIIYSKDPVSEAIRFKRDIINEHINKGEHDSGKL